MPWREFWSYNLVCEEVVISKVIPYCLFSVPILNTISTRGMIIKFQIKKVVHMGWANQKAQPKTKRKVMDNFKLSTSPTYLST
jgi:hypothetical protein